MSDILLDVRRIFKRFGANKVLDNVSLCLRRGEILALLGHNGSGKSTLVKILAGAYAHDAGTIERAPGVKLHFIHQTLGLVPSLTVAENLDLAVNHAGFGLGPVRRGEERRRIQAMLARFGVGVSPDDPVGALTAAERTVVAIVRAIAGWRGPNNVLVLDEPTATLHGEEVQTLKSFVKTVAAEGAGVIYITHRLAEAIELADRTLVLKNGVKIFEEVRGGFSHDDLVRAIAGASVNGRSRGAGNRDAAPILEAQGLVGARLRSVSFRARRGEILGVSGLVGSGMERLNGSVFGAFRVSQGTVRIDGEPLALGSPRSAIAAGVAYVPADRRTRASLGAFCLRENLTLVDMRDVSRPWGALNPHAERREALKWMDRLRIQPSGRTEQPFDLFSGGNQQKIVLAKWLRLKPRVLLVDEPTQGVDAGAQAEVYDLLAEAARGGAAVVVSSSDAKELAEICERVLVLSDGVVRAELTGEGVSEAVLIAAADDGRALAGR